MEKKFSSQNSGNDSYLLFPITKKQDRINTTVHVYECLHLVYLQFFFITPYLFITITSGMAWHGGSFWVPKGFDHHEKEDNWSDYLFSYLVPHIVILKMKSN